jgi:hypothetical protein
MFGMFNGGSGGVEGYTPETGLGSELGPSGGRRRRKSLRRKGARKGARKGTHKRARKHYGGYSQQKHQQGGDGEQEEADGLRAIAMEDRTDVQKARLNELEGLGFNAKPPPGDAQPGGSRRRKSRHSKKSHSKKTRGKKTSAWIKHVLQFAKDNKMKYFQALKDKRCRATYKSSK